MSLFDRDKSSERLPVALITGFLGSGKTTLLNRVLGGVSGETHAFPPPSARRPPYVHALEKSPVAEITYLDTYKNPIV